LLEILLVVAVIGILATVVVIAINPQRQLRQVEDAERRSEVVAIQNALEQYLIDNGEYPPSLTEGAYIEICSNDASDCSSYAELQSYLVPTYMASIPTEPGGSGSGSGYRVAINPDNGRVAVKASNLSSSNDDISVNDWFGLVLDEVPGAIFAYSTRQLSSTHNSSQIVRIRRVSDGYLADFGTAPDERVLAGESLGTNATEGDNSTSYTLLPSEDTLFEFCNGTLCEVVIWYDQSGNNNHASNTNTLVLPSIWDGGGDGMEVISGVPALYFDGDDGLNVASISLDGEVSSFFSFSTQLSQKVFGQPVVADSGGNGAFQNFYHELGRISGLQSNVWGDALIDFGSMSYSVNQPYVSTQIRSGSTNNWNFEMYLNDSLDSQTNTSVNPNGGDLTTIGYALGVSTFQGSLAEVIVYDSNQSANSPNIQEKMCEYINCE
jgi:type II secretory pathway pseudopilin PulG